MRKSIHFFIAATPAMAGVDKWATVGLLGLGVAFYAGMEGLRLRGVRVPVIAAVTERAARRRDTGFVLGPVTLGLGALLALLIYPLPAASIAIYALAFGDGFSSLVGKSFGRLRPRFLFGKSIEGSLACFAAAFACAWFVSGGLFASLVLAIIAAVIEALPLKNYDNLAIPLVTGLAATLFMRLGGF